MNEMATKAQGEVSTPLEHALMNQLKEQQRAMCNLAMLLRETNNRMKELENEVHHLVKVTAAQATEINAAIRQRAAEVCKLHRADGCEKAAAAAIRKAMRATCGTGTARDLPRCDFNVALRQVKLWDDYRAMQAIKAKEAGKHGD